MKKELLAYLAPECEQLVLTYLEDIVQNLSTRAISIEKTMEGDEEDW